MRNKAYLCASAFCLASAALFADAQTPADQTYKPSDRLQEGQLQMGYNAPAGIAIKSSDGKWLPDLFVKASFLYYHASEEGLEYADSAMLVPNITDTGLVVSATSNSRVLTQNFDYKPAFKVGIGTTLWGWEFSGEYTWIRQTVHTEKKAPKPSPNCGDGVWFMYDWFLQLSPIGQNLSATKVKSKWHLAMDLANLMLSRPYYLGRALTVAPAFGLEAAWIRQNVNLSIKLPNRHFLDQRACGTSCKNSSNSWALGPRAGFDTYLLLGQGFRLQGDVWGSVLFTEYTHVRHSEKAAFTDATPSTIKTKLTDYCCVRPAVEMGLGIGWGRYLAGEKYHVDVSAGYDFLVFWSQNMIRKLLDQASNGTGASPSNLNLHGLNISGRFDF